MKRYSKKQLEQKAEDKFNENPKAEKLHATSDGQFFLESNRADLWVKGKKLSVITIDRPTGTEDPQGKSNAGKDTKKVIGIKKLKPIVKAMTDKEALTQMLTEEKALEEPRKTAIELIEKRIAELDAGDDNPNANDNAGTDDNTGTDQGEEAQLLETISTSDSVEELTGLQEKEQANETPRQAVLDAIQERIIVLNKQ